MDGLLSEVAEIQRLCCRGELYEALVGELMSLWPVDDEDRYRLVVDRDKAKAAFMIFCMAPAKVIRESRAGRAIRRKWPHFWAAVYCIARDNEPKHIARMLQRKESELVLLGASARILTERPELLFGTVHDAIICDERHTRLVRGCIEDAYQQGIGVVPRIRVEEYGKVG